MTVSKEPARAERGPGATWAWDQYWRDGRLASCGGAGGHNYQPAIAAAWRRFFAHLNDGARVLDVCSGNGAVARLAAETAAARGLRIAIEAFDSAALAPPALPPRLARMVSFRSRIPAESTPYPSAAFHCVVGQYAVEYTDLARSLPELARVSAAACRVRFVCHAAEGVVVGAARRQLEAVERLQAAGDIFTAARALARAADAGRPSDADAAGFRAAHAALQRAAADSEEPEMYRNVGAVLAHALSVQPRVGLGPVLGKIDEVSAALAAHEARLRAMVAAAPDAARCAALAARAGELWRAPFRHAPLARADGALLGWAIETAAAPAPQPAP